MEAERARLAKELVNVNLSRWGNGQSAIMNMVDEIYQIGTQPSEVGRLEQLESRAARLSTIFKV